MKIIKSLFPLMITMGLFGSLYAAGGTAAKIQGVGTPACVSVSSFSWTAIPSTATIKAGRGGILISAPPTTAGLFNVAMTSSTIQTPGFSTSTFLTQMDAKDYIDLPVSQFVYIFAVSTHTASQDICYQEYTLELGR